MWRGAPAGRHASGQMHVPIQVCISDPAVCVRGVSLLSDICGQVGRYIGDWMHAVMSVCSLDPPVCVVGVSLFVRVGVRCGINKRSSDLLVRSVRPPAPPTFNVDNEPPEQRAQTQMNVFPQKTDVWRVRTVARRRLKRLIRFLDTVSRACPLVAR